MARSICIINGHPDAGPGHFVPALADAYERGARAAGHAVSRIDVAGLPVDFLHNETEFAEAPGPPVAAERDKMAGADHLVLIYPLWLGGMPARLKAFLEQAARAGFFIGKAAREGGFPTQAMKGKSARVIVTMGMPVFAYHLLFGGHSVKGVEAASCGSPAIGRCAAPCSAMSRGQGGQAAPACWNVSKRSAAGAADWPGIPENSKSCETGPDVFLVTID